MTAHLHSIHINRDGGVPKYRIEEARITPLGVEGDKQNNTKHHGGIMKAVCLFSLEVISNLQSQGHPIDCGTTGENIVITGLDWKDVQAGTILDIGEVKLEITMPASPCYKIAESFVDGDFSCISHDLDPASSRMYAKVLQEGDVKTGDAVSLVPSS